MHESVLLQTFDAILRYILVRNFLVDQRVVQYFLMGSTYSQLIVEIQGAFLFLIINQVESRLVL